MTQFVSDIIRREREKASSIDATARNRWKKVRQLHMLTLYADGES